ncbi:MAG: SBBP repeat-containing protein [Actinomycetota bacterium]|nr:SBBP repeat-containing protein [Actinomycetota bacterium]
MRTTSFSARAGGRSRGESGAARLLVPLLAGLASVAFLASGQLISWGGQPGARTTKSNEAAKVRAHDAYGSLPLSFELNKGQTDAGVDFLARGSGYAMFLTPTGLVTSLTKPAAQGRPGEAAPAAQPEPTVVRMSIVGANPKAAPAGRAKLPGVVNHLIGNDASKWVTGIPTYGKVAYQGVYPGVDMEYYGSKGGLEYDFIVKPGSDPRTITLGFDGAQALRIADNGDLVLSTPGGELRQAKPVLYQTVAGRRQAVPGSFVLRPGNQVGFEVGAYDPTTTLVIDPILDYSTFLGGGANDFGWGIAVDKSGRTYLGGETSSAVFPRSNDTPPGVTKPLNQGADAFVLRMDPEGDALEYLTFVGGTLADSGQDLAIDADGNAYLTGSTASGDFPVGVAANVGDSACGTDGVCNGASDHFLVKLNPAGNALSYASFLGGGNQEQHAPGTPYSGSAGIAVRGTTAYLHSNTFSEDFPVTGKAFQKTCASCFDGTSDGYLTVLDTAVSGFVGGSLKYSSYLGGDGDEQSKGVAVDESGNAYVTGITVSTKTDRKGDPTGTNSFRTKSAFQQSYRGGYSDAYVAKINPSASRALQTLVYSTFLGGGGLEEGWGIAVRDGKAYVTGYTTSGPLPAGQSIHPNDPATDPKPYFPTTAGAYQDKFSGRVSTDSGSTLFLDGDAFVTVLSPSGQSLVWSTFLGGPSADYGQGIALDSAGEVYVTGWTTCRLQDNRTTAGNEGDQAAQFEDDDADPTTPDVATGRNPGDPDATGVGDCDGQNPYGTSTPPPGVFPQVDPIVDAGRGLNESAMDTTFLGKELHNSPTGVFVTNLKADGSGVDYSVLLDGPGFDRGFAVAVRDRDAGNGAIPPEVYVTGRTGRQGFPVVASTAPGATLYDGTYNGAGRDAFISKLVG